MELTKDSTIMEILIHLEQRYGKDSFNIEDYWDGDLCTIGLSDTIDRYLLYLNTYGKMSGTLYAELQNKTIMSNSDKTTQVYETLTIEELDKVFRQYFINENT